MPKQRYGLIERFVVCRVTSVLKDQLIRSDELVELVRSISRVTRVGQVAHILSVGLVGRFTNRRNRTASERTAYFVYDLSFLVDLSFGNAFRFLLHL